MGIFFYFTEQLCILILGMVELNGSKLLFVQLHRHCFLLHCERFFLRQDFYFFNDLSHNLQNYINLYVVRDLLRLSCSLNTKFPSF